MFWLVFTPACMANDCLSTLVSNANYGVTQLCSTIADLTIAPTFSGPLELPLLREIKGTFSAEGIPGITSINLSNLVLVQNSVQVQLVPKMGMIALPNLVSVGVDLKVTGSAVASLDVPSLTSVSGNLEILNNDKLQFLRVPALGLIGSFFRVSSHPST